jgi:hypothetical protein
VVLNPGNRPPSVAICERNRPDDACLVIVDRCAWTDIHTIGRLVDDLPQALKRGIGLDPAELVIVRLAELVDAVSVGAVNAGLQRAKLLDEFFGSQVARVAAQTPFDRVLLPAEKAVGTLQEVLSRQVVLSTPSNLIPVFCG